MNTTVKEAMTAEEWKERQLALKRERGRRYRDKKRGDKPKVYTERKYQKDMTPEEWIEHERNLKRIRAKRSYDKKKAFNQSTLPVLADPEKFDELETSESE